MIKKIILWFSFFLFSFFSTYATEPDTSGLGSCIWLYNTWFSWSYDSNTYYFCDNWATKRVYNYNLTSYTTIDNYSGSWGYFGTKIAFLWIWKYAIIENSIANWVINWWIFYHWNWTNAGWSSNQIRVNAVKYKDSTNTFTMYSAGFYTTDWIDEWVIDKINISISFHHYNSYYDYVDNGSDMPDWYTTPVNTCTTRDMIRPFFRSYNYNGFYDIDSGSIINDSVNGEYLVPYNMNNNIGEVWAGLKVTTQTWFIQSVYSWWTTSTQFASSLINIFEKPYLFLKKVKNLQYSWINYIFVSGSFPSDSYRLYDCSIDDADRSKPIYNLDTNDWTNVYWTETGHILNQFYEWLCLEFDSSWANYQYINSYQFGSMTLKSQATTICQAPNWDYYDGSGTLLCSGSWCAPYNWTWTIDTGQTITPTEWSGFIDFSVTPWIAKIQSTWSTCQPFDNNWKFNYITTPGTMTITVNTGYKFINDWDFTIFSINLWKKLSDSINWFLVLIVQWFISLLNSIITIIINPLIQGLTWFDWWHYYCFFDSLYYMPTRITTYTTGETVGQYTSMDYMIIFIILLFTLFLIFKKK